MNRIHSHFRIANEAFLYVLSTFVFEPIRWNARFGWRTMCEQERLAFFYFWREVGSRMGIKDIPETYAAFERYNVEYEHTHFMFAESNRRVGTATRELFASWFPAPLCGPWYGESSMRCWMSRCARPSVFRKRRPDCAPV